MPLSFSIVTPSLNQGSSIEDTIRSVLSQNHPSVEHLVIDGGSTDGTLDILRRYPHLRWISERDRGQSHALNKGFRMAAGHVVGWLNADDTYCLGAFARVAAAFEDPSVMVVCGDGFEVTASGTIIRRLRSDRAAPDDLVRYWRWKYAFIQPSFFFRRSVFEQVGWLDESLHYAMDVDFFIRLGQVYAFRYLPEPLAHLRIDAATKTAHSLRYLIPLHIREMQRISYRHWGSARQWCYYRYLSSFIMGLARSLARNALLMRDSRLRTRLANREGRRLPSTR